MDRTLKQFEETGKECRQVFLDKMRDYGTAWRVLRVPSLTDQIYIKANRIRNIQEKGESRIAEGIVTEFIGIVNYSVMALIQLDRGPAEEPMMDETEIMSLYDEHLGNAMTLMTKKNHDYDEAWRSMRVSSITDIILMKIMRIKQIEDRDGKTFVSEGLDANYNDIINYAVFALIRLKEGGMK